MLSVALVLACLLGSQSTLFGQNLAKPGGKGGVRIRVNLPLTGSTDQLIKQMVQRVVEQQPEGPDRGVLVLEFWPAAGGQGRGTEFERALSLARYLTSRDLERVRTVAYVPRAAIGHAVLGRPGVRRDHHGRRMRSWEMRGLTSRSIGPTVRGGYTEDYSQPSDVA